MLPIKETDIYDDYRQVIERLSGDLNEVTQIVKNNIEEELDVKLGQNISECEDNIARMQQEVLELFKRKRDGKISQNEYDLEYKRLSDKILELQNRKSKLQEESFAVQLTRQRLNDIIELLSNNKIEVTNETLMKNLLDNIKVISKHEIEFQFKCGIKVVERV